MVQMGVADYYCIEVLGVFICCAFKFYTVI